VRAEIVVESGGRGLYDITPQLQRLVKASGLERGVALLYSVDPLCRLVTIEYDADLVEDLMTLISNLKARNPYVVASIFQPSVVVPFEGGLLLGAFQQICLLDLNEAGGARRVVVEVVG
jgi:thiamine phosphate synthase YjbQ (UPF0047 family)